MALVVLAARADLELAERRGEADRDPFRDAESVERDVAVAPAPETTTSATSRAPGWLA